MKAHLNFQDQPDKTLSVNAVYEGGFNKDSFAHAACFRALQFLETHLDQLDAPIITMTEQAKPAEVVPSEATREES